MNRINEDELDAFLWEVESVSKQVRIRHNGIIYLTNILKINFIFISMYLG
jgi:hypothetical protein